MRKECTMKKSRILITAGAIILAAAAALFFLLTVVFKDRIVSTEEKKTDDTMLILHKTESGKEISLPVVMSSTETDDGQHKIYIFVSENDDRKNYEAENLQLTLKLSDKLEITSRYCEWGEGKKRNSETTGKEGADIPSADGIKILEYKTESSYMILELTINGEPSESPVLSLQYDISGKGKYILNQFENISHEFEIDLQ